MRLTPFEISAIKEIVAKYDPEAKVYLFGSRTSDKTKGGDIDLFIDSNKITFSNKIDIKINLYDKIGEQKIDIVLSNSTSPTFVEVIKDNWILL